MKKIVIAVGLISLAVAVYLLFDFGSNSNNIPPSTPRTSNFQYVAAEGKVEAIPGLEVEIGSELIGRIERFYVKEGDRIKKGEVIARLGNRDIEAKLNEGEGELIVARSKLKEVASGSREEEIKRATAAYDGAIADMELAKKNLERYEGLYREGVIPGALLDEKENAFKVARARVREAEEEKRLLEKGPKEETIRLLEDTVRQAEATVEYYKRLLEKTFIISPISGKVIHKYLEEGEMVSEEIPMVAIADVEKIRINAEVDETDAAKIRIGDPAEITSDAYSGRGFKGEIEEIADYVGKREIRPNNPAKNLDMKVIQVKIKIIEKTPLKLGMTVDVRITPKKNDHPANIN